MRYQVPLHGQAGKKGIDNEEGCRNTFLLVTLGSLTVLLSFLLEYENRDAMTHTSRLLSSFPFSPFGAGRPIRQRV